MKIDENDSLVAQLKSPNEREAAFSRLLKLYGPKLYWHIRRIVVSHEDAEDAMQETSINVLNSIGRFEGKSSLTTWIYRIATNEALRVLRRRCSLFQSIDSLGDTLVEKLEAGSELDGDAAEIVFQKALLQLPTQQRIVFNMRYYDELPYEEISQITGKNVNTLKTNYHFATERIKRFVKENSI